jgi:putative transposase
LPAARAADESEDCLDWLLITGPRHLERVLTEYVHHYNHERPHRGLSLATPVQPDRAPLRDETDRPKTIRRRDRLGGLVHEYYADAA